MLINKKGILEALIIVLIVVDIIVLTSIYFINVSLQTYEIIVIFDTGLCIGLFAEFMYNLNSKKKRIQYIKNNRKNVFIDIIAMVPYELLTFGAFGFIRLLRLLRIVSLFEKGKKNTFNFIQKTKPSYVLITFLIILCVGSIAILVLESSPYDKINTPMDAIWYVMATISTVGYGDITPESFGGKLLGVILMIVGVGFFSLLTASLSSWLMKEHESEDEIKNKLTNMRKI